MITSAILVSEFFKDLLQFKQDEDNTWIVNDYQTTVYGDGPTLRDALKNYIISLIEFSEILVKSETEIGHVSDFVRRVNARAEANMEKTGKLEGAHYAAMQVELAKLEEELT
jgi:hypothetical protein